MIAAKLMTLKKRTKGNQTGKLLVNNKKKKVIILIDSIVKHIQIWELTKKLQNKQKFCVRQFSGSKVCCMKDYVQPSICKNNPNNSIFHVVAKDVE